MNVHTHAIKNTFIYIFCIIYISGTFIIFRIATIAWMTRWIVINKDLVPLAFYTVGSLGLATLTVMNIILFYRLLRSDFLRKKDTQIKDEWHQIEYGKIQKHRWLLNARIQQICSLEKVICFRWKMAWHVHHNCHVRRINRNNLEIISCFSCKWNVRLYWNYKFRQVNHMIV